jgi:hypothetical protein
MHRPQGKATEGRMSASVAPREVLARLRRGVAKPQVKPLIGVSDPYTSRMHRWTTGAPRIPRQWSGRLPMARLRAGRRTGSSRAQSAQSRRFAAAQEDASAFMHGCRSEGSYGVEGCS